MLVSTPDTSFLLEQFDPDKPVTLPGVRCAYCRAELTPSNRSDDHVVGRRFVPQGTITGFSLKLKACKRCNGYKSTLEDDISAITMLPDTAGNYARDDERLRATSKRKAKGARSPATRRLAAESYHQIEARLPIGGGMTLNYNGIAMPRIDDKRIGQLAYFHVQGFNFFQSFDRARGHGAWFEPSRFVMLDSMISSDWGNPALRYFTETVEIWQAVCMTAMADGYFRIIIRKNPAADVYAWALEWNDRMRVFGLCCDHEARDAFVAGCPRNHALFSYGDTTNGFALAEDTPLADSEIDRLFTVEGLAEPASYAAPHWREPA